MLKLYLSTMRLIKLTLAALLLLTPVIAITPVGTASADTPARSLQLTVNGQWNTTINYGGSIFVGWSSTGVTNCTAQPGNTVGTSSSYTLYNVKETTMFEVDCSEAHAKAVAQVLPPTFAYFKNYLGALEKKPAKQSVNTKNIVNQLNRAEKKYQAGDKTGAKKLLDKTAASVNRLVAKHKLSAEKGSEYAADINVFVGSWGKSVPSVTFSTDGCNVTASAPVGSAVDYGSHDGIWMRGFEATKVVPDAGVLTTSTGGERGMVSYGYIKDSAGKLLAGSSALITATTCPAPEGSEPQILANGGYPAQWADAPMDSLIDSWGNYNRESTSYAAFKVAASGRYVPYGLGNPNQWPSKAVGLGIPVDTTPKVGDVAISTAGFYGHAMYVEELLPGGGMRVSQYNMALTGEYSERTFTTIPTNLQFIHFPY